MKLIGTRPPRLISTMSDASGSCAVTLPPQCPLRHHCLLICCTTYVVRAPLHDISEVIQLSRLRRQAVVRRKSLKDPRLIGADRAGPLLHDHESSVCHRWT